MNIGRMTVEQTREVAELALNELPNDDAFEVILRWVRNHPDYSDELAEELSDGA